MQFAAILCECVRVAQGRGGGGLEKMVGNRLNLASQSKSWRARHSCRCRFLQKDKSSSSSSSRSKRSANCILRSNLQTKMCIKIYDECKSASQMKRGVQSTKRNYVIYVGLWLRNARQLGRRDDWKSLASQTSHLETFIKFQHI